jgi:membrane protease YdiL (CAAX protease family)
MALYLGQNPWVLILLIFLEFLLIIITASISAKILNRSLKDEIKDMGFSIKKESNSKLTQKIFAGIGFRFLFYMIAYYIMWFFKEFIIGTIFNATFIKYVEEGAINTTPFRPNIYQIILLTVLYIVVIAPCEEGFFRGFILKRCESKIGTPSSILFSSFCFSIYHIPPFIVPLNTIITFFGYFFSFGILLALIYKLFDHSLLPCICAHGIFNILILLF